MGLWASLFSRSYGWLAEIDPCHRGPRPPQVAAAPIEQPQSISCRSHRLRAVQWTYKSKVRIFIRNDTGRTSWRQTLDGECAPTVFPSKLSSFQRLQLEGPNGWDADDWPMPELAEVRVPPGRVFRIWIGLNLDISMGADRRNTEIRRRAVTRTLGVLEMTVRMHGVGHEWTMGF